MIFLLSSGTASPMEIIEVRYKGSLLMSPEEIFFTQGAVHFLSKEELQKFSYTDPHRALQSVPGLYFQEEDGFGLRPNIGLRGTSPHRSKKVTLMEDGILIAPAPYSAPAAYFFPNMMRIDSVEVFKGFSSVKYGPHSAGGVINFVTKPIPDERTLGIGLNYGGVNKYEFSIGSREGPWGYFLEMNRVESDGFKELPQGGDTGFERNDILFKGGYKKGSHNLFFKTAYGMESSHETYLGLTEEDFLQSSQRRYAASANDLMKWDHYQYQVGYSSVFKDVRLRAIAYLHTFRRNWSKLNGFNNGVSLASYLNPQSKYFDPHFLRVLRGEQDSFLENNEDHLVMGHNDRTYNSKGVDLTISYPFEHLSLYHELHLGFLHHQDQIRRHHTTENFKMIDENLHSLNQIRTGTQNTDSASTQRLSLTDIIDFSNGVMLSLGVRLENVRTKRVFRDKELSPIEDSYQMMVPGIGLQYSPSETLIFLLGVNKGLSAISPGQGNLVKPEESLNYEIGFKYRGLFQWEWIGFYNDYKNINGICSFSAGCQQENIGQEFSGGRAHIYGFESRIRTDLSISEFHFPLSLSYTKTFAGFLGNQISTHQEWGIGEIKKGDPLPYIPEDKISFSMGMKWNQWSSFLVYNWQGFVYDQVVKEGRRTVDSYGTLDWVGKYKYTKEGKVFIRVDNILASEHIVSLRPYGARPGKPQTFSVGLHHVF